jgi:uncharacterized membrane protein
MQHRSRLESIDVVRGIIMVLMALDHTRDYFGVAGNPTDLSRTTVALFLTRWVTHICAPTFFLLTGTSAFLTLRRRSRAELSRLLFTRGLWLILLELVVVRDFGFQFNFDYHVTMLVVIWALGWAMISLSLLLWLPVWAVTATGVVMICAHNLLDRLSLSGPVWAILHGPGMVSATPGRVVFAAYPLIPWIGVTALGYGFGMIYRWEPERRQRFLLRWGIALPALFVALRAMNAYGDPLPWSTQSSGVFTLLSFINVTKYPPSLLFLLMTLGPVLLMLRAFDTGVPRWLRAAVTYGRVPLFYFMLHLFVIHLLAVIVCFIRYGTAHWMFESPTLAQTPFTVPPGWGYPLPVVYLLWIAVAASLYPACRWFAAVKARRSDWWLSYL